MPSQTSVRSGIGTLRQRSRATTLTNAPSRGPTGAIRRWSSSRPTECVAGEQAARAVWRELQGIHVHLRPRVLTDLLAELRRTSTSCCAVARPN
jgi:hypothetical protein